MLFFFYLAYIYPWKRTLFLFGKSIEFLYTQVDALCQIWSKLN